MSIQSLSLSLSLSLSRSSYRNLSILFMPSSLCPPCESLTPHSFLRHRTCGGICILPKEDPKQATATTEAHLTSSAVVMRLHIHRERRNMGQLHGKHIQRRKGAISGNRGQLNRKGERECMEKGRKQERDSWIESENNRVKFGNVGIYASMASREGIYSLYFH